MKKACGIVVFVASLSVAVLAIPGFPDPTFNTTGTVITDFAIAGIGNYHYASGVAVDSQGRTVAAGYTTAGISSTPYDAAIARYNPDGTLDAAFNGTGKVIEDFGGSDVVAGVAVDAQDRIVIVGHTDWLPGCDGPPCGDGSSMLVARFQADGTLDPTFNGTGVRIIDLGAENDSAAAVAIDAQGRIVAAGLSDWGTAIVRLNPDGSFDSSFDGDGKLRLSKENVPVQVHAVAIDHAGRIVSVGRIHYTWGYVERLLDDGSFDPDFPAGFVMGNVADCPSNDLFGVAIDASDGLVLAGNCSDESTILVARATPGGFRDLSFGDAGVALSDFSNGTGPGRQSAQAVAIDGGGGVTIAGYATRCGKDLLVARYTSDGMLDPHFGPGGFGFTTLNLGSECGDDRANALAIDPQRRMTIAGTTVNAAGTMFGLARLVPERPTYFFSPTAPITMLPGGTGTTTLKVNSVDWFDEFLKIAPFGGVPAGLTWSFDGYGDILFEAPPANGSFSATLRITAADTVPPGTYVLSFFDSRDPAKTADVTVNVVTSLPFMQQTVERFDAAGYLTDGGTTRHIQAMLRNAQASAARGQTNAARNQLHALVQFLGAQAGRHIADSAVENGMAIDPAAILIGHVEALIDQIGPIGE